MLKKQNLKSHEGAAEDEIKSSTDMKNTLSDIVGETPQI